MVGRPLRRQGQTFMPRKSRNLTPEEERELLDRYWACEKELVRTMLRYFPRLRRYRPREMEWINGHMGWFIQKYCDEELRKHRRLCKLYDRYIVVELEVTELLELGQPTI